MANPRPKLAVLVWHGWPPSSERDTFEAVSRLLAVDYAEVEVNPDAIPKRAFDLYALWPLTCEVMAAHDWSGSKQCRAAVSIDICPSDSRFDYWLTSSDPRPEKNVVTERLLNLWGTSWAWNRQRPYMPFVLPITVPDAQPGRLPEGLAPRQYAVWNVQSHTDSRDESCVVDEALRVLVELGIRSLFLMRPRRTGLLSDWIGQSFDMYLVEDWSRGRFDAVMSQALCYMLSAPSVGPLSVERALAYGLPVVGQPTLARWGEWFVRPEELAAYRGNESVYQLRREVFRETFSDARALSVLRLARELGAARRQGRAVSA